MENHIEENITAQQAPVAFLALTNHQNALIFHNALNASLDEDTYSYPTRIRREHRLGITMNVANAVTLGDPNKVDNPWIHSAVGELLDRFLTEQDERNGIPSLSLLIGLLRELLSRGGKRVRPLLCYYGWCAAGGSGDTEGVLHAAASLELFHSFALIHDDVMDDSDTRRGLPTMHRRLADRHRDHPEPDRLGVNAAILLGDLTLSWSYGLLHAPGLPLDRFAAAWPLLNTMHIETMIGQYLDLLATSASTADLESAMRIARYKTAKYTVERPLHLGALVADAAPSLLHRLSAYAIPIGEIFQLHDDLLGVFGDPAITGKSNLDDLREGKHTALLAIALGRATAAETQCLQALVGKRDLDEVEATQVRAILTETGARSCVEEMIADRLRAALHVLDGAPFPSAVTAALRDFAHASTCRNS